MAVKMTHRERVRAALNHQEPDRVPLDLGSTDVSTLTLGAYRNLRRYLGLASEGSTLCSPSYGIAAMGQFAEVDEDVLQYFDIDFRPIFYRSNRQNERGASNSGRYVNEWGITLCRPKGGLYYDVVESPLAEANIDDLETYDWPDFLDPCRFEGLDREAQDLHENTDYALVGPGTEAEFFEVAWMLRGFERFLVDLLVNPEFAHCLLRKVLDIRKAMMGQYLELVGRYLDVVYYGDDVAMQTGPLISPDTYRTTIKPYQKEFFQFITERTDAKILYHCDGNITALLEDFIEIGAAIINPVQVSAQGMDTKWVKDQFGDRICFWGAIDTQHVLPNGNVEEVREEVRRRVADLAVGGGYVLAPVHNIQPDVPPENVCAMYDEAKVVGDYPISI